MLLHVADRSSLGFFVKKQSPSPLNKLIGTELYLIYPEMPWLSNSFKKDLSQRDFHSCFHNLLSLLTLQNKKNSNKNPKL